MVFNGLIRSSLVGSYEMIMSIGLNLKLWFAEEAAQISESPLLVALLLKSIAEPVVYACLLRKHQKDDSLSSSKFHQKFSILTNGLEIKQSNKAAIFFYPVFLARRFLIVAFPTIIFSVSSIQLQLALLTSSLYIIFYVGVRPHRLNSQYYLELTNEILIMLSLYLLVLFSDFNLNNQFKFQLGFALPSLVLIMIAINISVMTFKNFQLYQSRQRYKVNLKFHLEKLRKKKLSSSS